MHASQQDDLFTGANLAALLGRPLRAIPAGGERQLLGGARILVTGAGGSVGSALIRQLAPLQPARILALDIHEGSLFRLERESPPALPLEVQLADVRSGRKLTRIFEAFRPDIVVHLAAYKHVPLGERSPDEPISVNVFGTEAVARAAIESGAAHLVFPSSDKAVNPPSVYGATKRLAEAVLLWHARTQRTTAVHIVRYVNIVGSSGSALETFAVQARAGRPLTITDHRMARYWMAMEEAIALCWHALRLGSGSHTVLDVGDPIPVRTLAERVAHLVRPDGPEPDFVETGPRPGERLLEELASARERLIRCRDEPVWQIERQDGGEALELVPATLSELQTRLERDDPTGLRRQLMEAARLLQ